MTTLTAELEEARKFIKGKAEALGLNCFDTIFEVVNAKQLNEIAAKGGFPVRYPHWRFGMEYENLSKSYEYGLSKIYELVINNNPCYAYLMEGNDIVDQKLVMAHVFGHCDFFKNNRWFEHTNRKMIDQMANHAVRVRRYVDEFGLDTVEDFIDKCLSIENLIDAHKPYREAQARRDKTFMSDGDIKADRERLTLDRADRDILLFLMNHAPLTEWQHDILGIIRDEAYYFAPQGMTKIMNEGWASYWHAKLMTEEILSDSEFICFADRHAGALVIPPSGFNPYKIGIELFRNIEQRWDRGQFGREWDECKDLEAKKAWNTQVGKGREKIFQVRRDYNDVMFIDEFLTEEFCLEHRLFVYKFNRRTNQYEVDNRDFKVIKQKFLFQITNLGQPIISVVDGNFNNKGELLLTHLHEGVDMQPGYTQATMENIYSLWKSTVNLATVLEGEGVMYTYNGQEFKQEPIGGDKTSTESEGPLGAPEKA